MATGSYLRPLLAPFLDGTSPVADTMIGILDTSFAAQASALTQATLDHDPRTATGDALDNMAGWGGLKRAAGEGDTDFRRRVTSPRAGTPNTKMSIAIGVTALTGNLAQVITDGPGHCTVLVYGSTPRAGDVMPLVRSLKASGVQVYGATVVPVLGLMSRSGLGTYGLGQRGLGGSTRTVPLPDTAIYAATPVALGTAAIVTPGGTQRSVARTTVTVRARLGQFGLGQSGLGK